MTNKKYITYVKEKSKLDVGAIIYYSQERGAELHTSDAPPENLGFFKTEKELKKQIKEMIKKEFFLPIRIKICIRTKETDDYRSFEK